jgi:hypothetical protein
MRFGFLYKRGFPNSCESRVSRLLLVSKFRPSAYLGMLQPSIRVSSTRKNS